MSDKAERNKNGLKKAAAVILLIVGILMSLSAAAEIVVCAEWRDEKRVEAVSENREELISLLMRGGYGGEAWISRNGESVVTDSFEQWISLHSEELDGVEYLRLMHKYSVTATFGDTEANIIIRLGRCPDPLLEYIGTEGYNMYLHSREFALDLLKTVPPTALSVFSIALLIKCRKNARRESSDADK